MSPPLAPSLAPVNAHKTSQSGERQIACAGRGPGPERLSGPGHVEAVNRWTSPLALQMINQRLSSGRNHVANLRIASSASGVR
jgi:hypothetical protein